MAISNWVSVKAVTANGTSWMFCSRRWAVTTISSMRDASWSAAAVCATAGAAVARTRAETLENSNADLRMGGSPASG
jgi:hypothetical protein